MMHPRPAISDDDDSDKSGDMSEENFSQSRHKAREHVEQLQRLQEKDPEFYNFLKDHDKELLEFNDEGIDDDVETDLDDLSPEVTPEKVHKASGNVITTEMVDSWCKAIRENSSLGAIRSLMRAFKTACHYGDDDDENNSSSKLRNMSSSVFNKIMFFVLSEIDGVLRKLLKVPSFGGKKETIINLMTTKEWKNYGYLVKSYLGNALHVLNQMTDNQMISFTLRRLRYSAIFFTAFPTLLRKYIKVALHFWGSGGGALPVVSFLFLRDLCIRLGSDCLDMCLKGIYRAYVLNCQYVSASRLQHIQFLGNCVIELYSVDPPSAYQHAFIFIRQLAMILRDALTVKTKESFRKVYEWKFINCLELWTGLICVYKSEADFQPLAYPLTQILFGVARLVPTARYFPLRLRCGRMLNRIATSTGTFIPVSILLLDMLEMKELRKPPTGGVGKAIDLFTTLKVSKQTLKTRAFQEACIFAMVEVLAEHLAQWSYSIAFFELSFIPIIRLRSFCKTTKVERFRREIRQLICQVEATSEFANTRRINVGFSPNDPAASSFLEVERDLGASPLSQFVATLRQRARQRNDIMEESSVLIGEDSSMFSSKKITEIGEQDMEEGAVAFSSSWLPRSASKSSEGTKSKRSKKHQRKEIGLDDEDVVEDLVLSSDEDEPVVSDSPSIGEEHESKGADPKLKQESKNWKQSTSMLKNRGGRAKKQKIRKSLNPKGTKAH